MRILHVNKFFYQHGGSETMFFLTRELLRTNGHEVIDFSMQSPRNLPSPYSSYFAPHRDYSDSARGTKARALDALASVYSVSAQRSLRRLIADHRPEIAHLHLIYHQLTLSLLVELERAQIPIVLTAHDCKPACPAYTLFRDGQPCRDCVGRSPLPVLRNKCIRGSALASSLAFAEATLARQRHLYEKVNRWIAPSSFCAGVLAESGIAPHRIEVIPNFLPDEEFKPRPQKSSAEPRFVYAGRLEATKGVDDLLALYEHSNGELGTLVLAGNGALLESVKDVTRRSPHIEYLGVLARSEVRNELLRARAALLPAKGEENYPMSVLEAQAARTAVITSDRGGLADLVHDQQDGLVTEAGDRTMLRTAIATLAKNPELAAQLGDAGYTRLTVENTAAAYYDALQKVYSEARSERLDRHRH